MKKTLILCAMALVVLTVGCGRGGEDGGRGSRVVLQNKGSDTLVNVAQAWAENYKDVNPNLAVAVTGGGSGTGISAMINGTVDIANASRKMKDKEMKMAQDNGIDPVEWTVGFDALAVFLHHDNPIEGI
jgi:phosphate transport system substrate-binding protein